MAARRSEEWPRAVRTGPEERSCFRPDLGLPSLQRWWCGEPPRTSPIPGPPSQRRVGSRQEVPRLQGPRTGFLGLRSTGRTQCSEAFLPHPAKKGRPPAQSSSCLPTTCSPHLHTPACISRGVHPGNEHTAPPRGARLVQPQDHPARSPPLPTGRLRFRPSPSGQIDPHRPFQARPTEKRCQAAPCSEDEA